MTTRPLIAGMISTMNVFPAEMESYHERISRENLAFRAEQRLFGLIRDLGKIKARQERNFGFEQGWW